MLCGTYYCSSWCSSTGKVYKFNTNISKIVSSFIGKMKQKYTIFRFMLKSLGQWTSLSLKPRKIIPSTLTLVPSKPPERGQGEPVILRHEMKYINFFKLFYFMNLEIFFINFYLITFSHFKERIFTRHLREEF